MLRVSEVANRLNVSVSKIYLMVQRKEIEHHRIGGTILFTEAGIEELMGRTKMERSEPEPRKSKPPRPTLRHIKL